MVRAVDRDLLGYVKASINYLYSLLTLCKRVDVVDNSTIMHYYQSIDYDTNKTFIIICMQLMKSFRINSIVYNILPQFRPQFIENQFPFLREQRPTNVRSNENP